MTSHRRSSRPVRRSRHAWRSLTIGTRRSTGRISDVLVPIRGAIDVSRLTDLVATLLSGSDGQVTFRAMLGDSDNADATQVLNIVDRSGAFDAIVMGEGHPPHDDHRRNDRTHRGRRSRARPCRSAATRTLTASRAHYRSTTCARDSCSAGPKLHKLRTDH